MPAAPPREDFRGVSETIASVRGREIGDARGEIGAVRASAKKNISEIAFLFRFDYNTRFFPTEEETPGAAEERPVTTWRHPICSPSSSEKRCPAAT
jgi:hypothetical protein